MTDLFPGRFAFYQLVEWGFPQGSLRPVPPATKAFSVIHITGNPQTPIATAAGELGWRIDDPANQNSATFFVDRNGDIWQALGDPLRMDPWSNGDVNRPDTTNPRIAGVLADGVNANERTLISIENVGRPSDLPLTEAQIQANAALIRYYHTKAGLPITRQTVVGHYQLNSVERPNCPAIDKRVIDRIVALATLEESEPVDMSPGTWHARVGTVVLRAGVEYNAFRFVGRNPDGSPVLLRLNGINYDEDTPYTVIGLMHWEPGQPESNCYLVTPYIADDEHGRQSLVWWSKAPAQAPAVTWVATDCTAEKTAAATAARADLNQKIDTWVAARPR